MSRGTPQERKWFGHRRPYTFLLSRTEANSFQIKRGETDEIEYGPSGDVTELVLDLIGDNPGGLGHLKVGRGDYYFDDTISLPPILTRIEGEGFDTRFWPAPNTDKDLLKIAGTTAEGGAPDRAFGSGRTIIEKICLMGDKAHNSLGSGIVVDSSQHWRILHVIIRDFAEDGILTKPNAPSKINENGVIEGCPILNNGKKGINIQSKDSVTLCNYIYGNGEEGIYHDPMTGGWMHKADHLYANLHGIRLVGTVGNEITHVSIIGCYVEFNRRHGIYLEDEIKDCTLEGNEVWANSQESSGAYDGIILEEGRGTALSRISVIGGFVGDNHRYSISTWGSAGTPNTIQGVTVKDPMRIRPIDKRTCRGNSGWITENRGTKSVTGAVNSVVVDHGLDGIPTIVIAEPQQDSGDVWITNKTLTQFTINFDVQPGGATWYFDWYAEV